MQDKLEHTPTPWLIHGEPWERKIYRQGTGLICAVTDFGSFNDSEGRKESEANAQYIIKCVNSYQALIDALKETDRACLDAARLAKKEGRTMNAVFWQAKAEKVEAALALAGGESE